jgi:hypothetical protein
MKGGVDEGEKLCASLSLWSADDSQRDRQTSDAGSCADWIELTK